MGLPYFPLYVDDYEADTPHLTLEEDGALSRLLRLCWRTPGCEIPADHKWIQRRLRVDEEVYERSVRPILEEFFKRRGSKFFNTRLSSEYERAHDAHARRVSAGRKGGQRRKSLKNQDRDSKHCSSNGRAMPKQPEPKPNTPQPPDWPHANSELIVSIAEKRILEKGDFQTESKHEVEVMRALLSRGLSVDQLKEAGAPVHRLDQ